MLTSFPLPLGYLGDILGGGFLLSLASFVVATAALETGSPYAQLGSSRAKTFSAITEPVVLFVVFTVALLTGTDLLPSSQAASAATASCAQPGSTSSGIPGPNPAAGPADSAAVSAEGGLIAPSARQ